MTPAVPMMTLPEMFEDCVRRHGANVMMWEKRGGVYRGTSYRDMQTRIHRCAAGLSDLGIRKGDRIALLSEGRNDWVTAELGMLYAGAVDVPLSVKIEERSELRFRLVHSGCRMIIASGTQLRKVMEIRERLPELERVIVFDGESDPVRGLHSFGEILARGEELLRTRTDEFEGIWQSIEGADPANICYTSGTTADPKGIVLTHRNYTANVEQAYAILPFPSSYCSLLILPWDHSFAHTVMYLLMRRGASIASVEIGRTPMETLKNIAINIREIRPTILLSVPSLAKNFRKNVEKGVREKGTRAERLFRRGLESAYAFNRDGWTRGEGTAWWLRLQYAVFDALIFRKIRQGFGGRLDYFIGGGALLDVELQRFFYAIGIPMYQGYGLTEAAPIISANVPERHKMGSSGTVLPSLEARICDDEGRTLPSGQKGEIVVRGENVMAGYWKNDKATSEALRDGWLFTGDLGYIDEDGFLFVVGRKKSLLIGHDGEKYSPEAIEETIVAHSRIVDQIMLYNNQSQYTIGLLVPNREALTRHLSERGLSSRDIDGQDAALTMIEGEIERYRAGGEYGGMFPERWLPTALALLDEPFTEQNRLLNSTLKVVRGRVAETHKERIQYLFTQEGRDIRNPLNRRIIENLEVE
jgi:long-chain acyl-CoA synthetase